MRNVVICLMVILIAALVWTGCSKSDSGGSGNTVHCDTTSVGYTRDILPILQTFCYSCHAKANSTFANGIDLQGKDSGYLEVSGWANAGYLVGNVAHAPGFIGMPYGKPKLNDCDINKIIAWVNRQYPH